MKKLRKNKIFKGMWRVFLWSMYRIHGQDFISNLNDIYSNGENSKFLTKEPILKEATDCFCRASNSNMKFRWSGFNNDSIPIVGVQTGLC